MYRLNTYNTVKSIKIMLKKKQRIIKIRTKKIFYG